MNGCGGNSSNASFMQICEDAARIHGLFDQFIFIRVEKMSDEACVLIHDVRPERRHLGAIEFRFPAGERLETASPAFGFMPCVVEEEGPYETAQFAAALRVAEPGFVFDERLNLLHHATRISLARSAPAVRQRQYAYAG